MNLIANLKSVARFNIVYRVTPETRNVLEDIEELEDTKCARDYWGSCRTKYVYLLEEFDVCVWGGVTIKGN